MQETGINESHARQTAQNRLEQRRISIKRADDGRRVRGAVNTVGPRVKTLQEQKIGKREARAEGWAISDEQNSAYCGEEQNCKRMSRKRMKRSQEKKEERSRSPSRRILLGKVQSRRKCSAAVKEKMDGPLVRSGRQGKRVSTR